MTVTPPFATAGWLCTLNAAEAGILGARVTDETAAAEDGILGVPGTLGDSNEGENVLLVQEGAVDGITTAAELDATTCDGGGV